jgi:hypothetical protein
MAEKEISVASVDSRFLGPGNRYSSKPITL